MGRDDPQFNLRLPYELKEKLKQRAKSNGRSLNTELVQIVTDAVSKPSKISGYRDDAERIADEQSELVRRMVFDTLKDLYKNPPDGGFHLLVLLCRRYKGCICLFRLQGIHPTIKWIYSKPTN